MSSGNVSIFGTGKRLIGFSWLMFLFPTAATNFSANDFPWNKGGVFKYLRPLPTMRNAILWLGPLLSVLHDKGCELWFDRCIFGLCPVFLQDDLHAMTSRLAAPTLVATQYTVRSGQLSWSSRRMVSKWSSKSFLTWGLVANNNFCRVCYRFCEV